MVIPMVQNFSRTLKVGAVDIYPYFSFLDNGKYEGVCYQILLMLAEFLNFNFTIEKVKAGGIKLLDGTWSPGIIKSVKDNKFDIGLDTVSVTMDRYEDVDFTIPFMYDISSVMSPRPQLKSKAWAILDVFTSRMWLILISTLVILGPVLYMFDWSSRRFPCRSGSSDENIAKWNINSYMWFIVSSLFQQGYRDLPTSNAVRILIGSWLLFLIVLLSVFSGRLLTVAYFPNLTPPIDSLMDLERHKEKLDIGAFRSSSSRAYLQEIKTFPNVELSELGSSLLPSSPEEAMILMRRGNYALISEGIIFNSLILQEVRQHNHCPWYVGKQSFLTQWYSLIVAKGHPHLRSFNFVIQRIIEGGLIKHWLNSLTAELQWCAVESLNIPPGNRSLTLADVQGPLCFLLIGYALALVSFISEYILYFLFSKNVRASHFKNMRRKRFRVLIVEKIL